VQDSAGRAFSLSEAVVIFIPRFAAVALGILLRPAGGPCATPAASQAAMAGFDAIDAVFVGTVLDVWNLGDRQVARFVVDRPAKGTRLGEIIGVVSRPGAGDRTRIGTGEQWMIVADRWLETA
jgi:hypothetical protein